MTAPFPPKRPGLVKRETEVEETKKREKQAGRKRSLIPFDLPDPIVGPSNPEGQERQRRERALKRMKDALMKTGKGMFQDPEKPAKLKLNLEPYKRKDYKTYGKPRPSDRIAD